MKIAIFGKSGQVATELQRRAPMDVTTKVVGRELADFTQPQEVAKMAEALDADVIINAVAYTAVDQAESEPDLANVINGRSVGALAEVAAKRNIPLIHYSTDYVFDGSGTASWKPDDTTAPLGMYGHSKLSGEDMIRGADGPHAILRTSWVFSAHGNNFVKTMLRLGAERDKLTIVSDQIGGPTPATALADAAYTIARWIVTDGPSGTFHLSGAPDVSWADFAREIFQQARLNVDVAQISSDEFPTDAARPLNSRLDCTSLETTYGIQRPDWHIGLADVIGDLSR